MIELHDYVQFFLCNHIIFCIIGSMLQLLLDFGVFNNKQIQLNLLRKSYVHNQCPTNCSFSWLEVVWTINSDYNFNCNLQYII